MVSKQPRQFVSRRTFAASLTGVVLAGCSGGNGGTGDGEGTATDTPTETATETPTPTPTPTEPAEEADATIIAGPGGNLVFDPDALRISTGDTVEWQFDSASHNVSGHPDAASAVSLPEGAEPFASYDISVDDINHNETEPAGATYRYTFEVAGEYTYVCVPHAAAGMVADLIVR
jgi:plastocyanin